MYTIPDEANVSMTANKRTNSEEKQNEEKQNAEDERRKEKRKKRKTKKSKKSEKDKSNSIQNELAEAIAKSLEIQTNSKNTNVHRNNNKPSTSNAQNQTNTANTPTRAGNGGIPKAAIPLKPRAAENVDCMKDLFISNLNIDTTEKNLEHYIKNTFKCRIVECKNITPRLRFRPRFLSFKVSVPSNKTNEIKLSEQWDSNIIIEDFRVQKTNNSTTQNFRRTRFQKYRN